jgi:uncharacterized phage-like protein YoqJ
MVDFSRFRTEEYKKKRAVEASCEEFREATRLKTCSFTGHRPDKLPGGYNWNSECNQQLGRLIREQVIRLITEYGVDTFIFGGALGIDQMAFAICLKLKRTKYKHIKLILAMPFEGQDSVWRQESKDILQSQRDSANLVVIVDELDGYRVSCVPVGEYHPDKMKKRNEYLVDNSHYLISVWDGTPGGTGSCVSYAHQQRGSGRTIIWVHPRRLDVAFQYC